ncbi:CRISPR-associated endonuclease Cas3'' [Saliphagus sp. LR7]|uniref:CRISPR-associated endonuclease Cas3'' n=1 Tax=Saliphagus sp. LR7 TaxID=2282654 RepID=UPI000DF7827D|nr:CRISPR-associated endonuclease Cas3'' [Saliphagus sp. LR7]
MATVYSHPPESGRDGVVLTDHLEDVAERVGYVVPQDATTPSGESLFEVVETLAHVHDFGKATTYFQEYLLESRDPEFEACRYHAPIGSFAAYFALDARGFVTETCLAGFVAVAKHHGRLPDVADYVVQRTHRREGVSGEGQNSAERQQAAIAKQLQNIDEHAPDLADAVFYNATGGVSSWGEFYDAFGGLLGEIESIVATSGSTPGVDQEALSESCYALVLECWGSLVLADKTSAAELSNGIETTPASYDANRPSLDRLDEYVGRIEAEANADPGGTRVERLNHFRSSARSSVLENAETFADDGGGIATLTLPTGMGKTLSGLSAALAIRDRRGGGRIVYALPFTSIIDQVVDEIEKIYGTDTTGRLLTAHHHLSETTIRDERQDDPNEHDGAADDADRNDDIAGMLAQSWRAGLTVTTFVQLFESLAGPTNKQSMKLPALRNSVVVLDEPQSLPLDWWKLVPRLVAMLTERYDATVVAMTATQPQLFDNATDLFDDVTELVDDPEIYFEATERVTYELDPSTERYIEDQADPKSYADATAALLEAIESDESALAVCNTIDSAKTLTEHVTDAYPGLGNVGEVYADELDRVGSVDGIDPEALAERVSNGWNRSLLHLSTRLRPVDRLRLIETAKELTKRGYPLVTVSTQLVEAGVDISFDRVYRDLAPIDSIVQAAGRCNRSFESDRGRVTVWWLDVPGDQAKTPAEAVYNRSVSLLPVAASTLDSVRAGDGTLSETDVARSAVESYYERLHQEKNVGKQTYADYVDDVRADELGRLSLIDQRLTIDVIVCRTDDECTTVESIRTAWENYEFDRVRTRLDETKALRVSIPIYRADSEEAQTLDSLTQVHPDTDIRWLDTRTSRYGKYFEPTTGFVVPDSTVEARFL